jgi:polar amino acid transport system substrate-binding protein
MSKMRFVAFLAAALAASAAQAQAPVEIPKQKIDQTLRARLPADILKAGYMISVNSGSFPPYIIVNDTKSMSGASGDLTVALGELLGIRIENETVHGLAGILAGIKSGRYQLAVGPIGDFPDRQAANDFVDYVKEYVVFAVQKGNPKKIASLDDTCGTRISVMAAGSAERVIKAQAEACQKAGKPVLEVQSYPDQPTSILAVRSGRADAFFSSQAPLTYFVQQANGQLELAATGKSNGFEDLFQGTVVPKDSELGRVVADAYKVLFANGTYAAIMKKWGLEGNMIDAPGINLAKPK